MNKKLIVAGAVVLAVSAGLVSAANQIAVPTKAVISAQSAPKANPVTPGGQLEQGQQADPVDPAEANDSDGADTDGMQDGPQDGPEDPNESPETPSK